MLILLSGHGVHARGRDFLVPEDIQEDTRPFESGCVAIDWRAHLDETPAGRVVFLIDACREGIEQESMGVATVRHWSRQKVGAALRRKVAYVYACSPGQFALFVRSRDKTIDPVVGVRPGDSFSIFSRSVSDVIAAHPGTVALGLQEFQRSV
ncbi:caspase family protein [Streptomyces sp. NPDC056626]|uniref:caspase family protein n=1 Tax=unclassified Streptomyces TaxID=2593676 RepID=UPI00367A0D37